MNSTEYLTTAMAQFQRSLAKLPAQLAGSFDAAIAQIEATKAAGGHVIFSGMGKSGLIAQKLSATFASTGSPAFFLHPAEALHGDLGAITPADSLCLISNSGETAEMVALLPTFTRLQNASIAMVGRLDSTLGRFADVALDISVDRELCPLDVAPTTSTLMTLAAGDMLAVQLMHRSGFQTADFARLHPGGSLGRKLLTRVADVMHTDNLPCVAANTPLKEALLTMSAGRLGLAIITEDGTAQSALKGVLSDGDLRRALQKDANALEQPVATHMNARPRTIAPDANLNSAEAVMREHLIKALVVVDDVDDADNPAGGAIVGVLELYQ